jgi:hypothetical protein
MRKHPLSVPNHLTNKPIDFNKSKTSICYRNIRSTMVMQWVWLNRGPTCLCQPRATNRMNLKVKGVVRDLNHRKATFNTNQSSNHPEMITSPSIQMGLFQNQRNQRGLFLSLDPKASSLKNLNLATLQQLRQLIFFESWRN